MRVLALATLALLLAGLPAATALVHLGCTPLEEGLGCRRWSAREGDALPHLVHETADVAMVGATAVTLVTVFDDEDSHVLVLGADAATGLPRWRFASDGPRHDLAVAADASPDGATAFVAARLTRPGGVDATLLAFDAATGALRWSAAQGGGGKAYAADVAADPVADRVYVLANVYSSDVTWNGTAFACEEGTYADWSLRAHRASTGELLWSRTYDRALGYDWARTLAVAADGSALVVGGATGGTPCDDPSYGPTGTDPHAAVFDPATGALRRELPDAGPGWDWTHDVAVADDGRVAVVASRDDGAELILYAADGATLARRLLAVDGAHLGAQGVAFDPAGASVFVTAAVAENRWTSDVLTAAFDATDGTPRWSDRYRGSPQRQATTQPDAPGLLFFLTDPSDERPRGLGTSPDGRLVYVSAFSEWAFATLAYDAATGARVWTAREAPDPLIGGWWSAPTLDVAPDGTVLVAGMQQSAAITVAYHAGVGPLNG